MTARRRWWIWVMLPIVLIGVTIGGYHWAKKVRFDTDAPEADFPPPATAAEARAQDVEHLALFFELERSWTPETATRAGQLYEQLLTSSAELSDARFEMAVARVVAAADNAHTKVREYHRTPLYSRLPIRGHVFDDGYFVIRAYAGYEHLLGKQITAIEGRSMEALHRKLRPYVGGPEGSFNKYLPYLLESPNLMYGAGLTASPETMSVTFADAAGVTETVKFEPPYPSSEDHIARSHMLLVPQVYSESQPDWQAMFQPDVDLPIFLRAAFEQFQFLRLENPPATYLQFWTNNDSGDVSITEFCENALDEYRREPTDVLIIDHRFNGGGNMLKTAECMEGFGKAVPEDGRLFVVTAGTTFSAGIGSAAIARVAAGERGVLIGTRVGDRLSSWGEDNLLKLPNSGIEIKFSTGKHDIRDGCTDWKDCFWGTMSLGVRIDSMDPDIVVPFTFDDYRNLRDPVMEAIKAQGDGA